MSKFYKDAWIAELIALFAVCIILLLSWWGWHYIQYYFRGDDGRLVAPLSAPMPSRCHDDLSSNDDYDDTGVGELEAYVYEL